MPVPIGTLSKERIEQIRLARKRAQSDLIRNANCGLYCNERGFRQKLIDTLYSLGYYEDNESIYDSVKE